ncbi:MAG TPA: hypothetical protein VFV89_23505 [Nocardioides sp.]|uniref:hypothetical protein n=1 Tax=Nocardioides sp. TaxID=35761 RepID=UPI002E37280B|nr:hypothetical protein [Nocardioides sp.]HEX5090796.1 hypothetical protein [Nocardioides sp.]
MNDLEQRLTDALVGGAQEAPAPVGLADAARARARSRRRARMTGAAALVALCIGVPTAVVAVRGSDSAHPGPSRVTDNPTGVPSVPEGQRVESWHGVTALVPDSWGHGSLEDWCADGGRLEPRVERPGGLRLDIKCETSTYGLSFQQLPPGQDRDQVFDWPVTLQTSKGWPPDAEVGAHGIGDVLVEVTAPTSEQAQAILGTVRPIGPEGDPNGCMSSRGEAPPAVPNGLLRICRYDAEGLLEQSETLTGSDPGAVIAALEAAPAIDAKASCPDAANGPQPVVRLLAPTIHADVDLGGDCARIHGLGTDRALTSDVLYWSLSPGWSGSVPANVPLPSELRTE